MPKKDNKELKLIFLCWLVYTCSYVGRLSYNANINQIGLDYSVSYSDTGMVTTFFFFVYGIGQVLNGIFCKKYPIKYVIFGSLFVSSLMNLLVMLTNEFSIIKYLWLINGISMSFLWTSLIRLLSENISKNQIDKAIIIMGTTVACGTFVVYGISALFALIANYRFVFGLAFTLLLVVSILWLVSFDKLVIMKEKVNEVYKKEVVVEKNNVKHSLALLFIILAIFAVANNFVKDGLTSWTPDILASLYDTPGWLSILLTLLLPVLAFCGTAFVVKLRRIINSFIGLGTLLYTVSVILLFLVIYFIKTPYLPITISCFALIACLMSGVNNIVTSIVPLSLSEEVNSGKLAGILNGFCYLGSTISAYGLGLIADNFGWSMVLWTLEITIIVVSFIGILFLVIEMLRKKHKEVC